MGQLDLELQCRALAMAPGQRHQQPRVEALAARRLDLAADEVERALAVDRQHVIGKAGEIHGGLLLAAAQSAKANTRRARVLH